MKRVTLSLCSVLTFLLLTSAGCGEVVSGNSDAGIDPQPSVDSGVITPSPDANPCLDMLCECRENSDCGPAARCETTPAGRECVCAPGFEEVEGACVWGVVPRDPGFQDPTVWQTSGGGGISPLSTGSIDPGEAFFGVDSVCNLGAVSQTFPMPPYEVAGPLVASLTYRMLGGGGMPGPNFGVGAGLAFNGGWAFLPQALDWSTQRVCLGERAYEGQIDIRVSPSLRPLDCDFGNPTNMFAVDHLAITPAEPNECPTPATVLNGDFEREDGWELNAGGGGAVIAPGAGPNGSRALRLTTSTLCTAPSARGRGSWPSASMPSPAIEVSWVGTAGKALNITVADRLAGTLIGTGNAQVSRICVSPVAKGVTSPISIALPSTSGLCAEPDVRDFVIDDIRVVNEPACGTNPGLLGGGFEEYLDGRIVNAWTLQSTQGRSTAQVVNNASRAHSGNGVLEFMVQQECSTARAAIQGLVPLPTGDAGPALKYWYFATGNAQTTFSSSPGSGPLAETGTWAQATVCLSPSQAGRPLEISFQMDPGSGTCATTFPQEFGRIDDVELTTDPSCPRM